MLRNILFQNEKLIHKNLEEALESIKSESISAFIDILNPTKEELEKLCSDFGLHHLAYEDCLSKVRHPKVDDYKGYYFIIVPDIESDDKNMLTGSYIYCFLSKSFFITIRYSENNVLDSLYKSASENEIMRERGCDFLLYSLFNIITDKYFIFIDKMEQRIDHVEIKAMNKPEQHTLNEIMMLKKKILKFKRIVSPQREVLNKLLRFSNNIIQEKHNVYFSDIYEHILRLYDIADSYQEMLASCLELYSSQQANAMNSIMKMLTIVTTILMPITVITGIYGMNFENMPELHVKHGYIFFWIAVIIITSFQCYYIRKKKWL